MYFCKARRATEVDAQEAEEVVTLSVEDRVLQGEGAGFHHRHRRVEHRGNHTHIGSAGRASTPRTICGARRENRRGLPHPVTFRQCDKLVWLSRPYIWPTAKCVPYEKRVYQSSSSRRIYDRNLREQRRNHHIHGNN